MLPLRAETAGQLDYPRSKSCVGDEKGDSHCLMKISSGAPGLRSWLSSKNGICAACTAASTIRKNASIVSDCVMHTYTSESAKSTLS